MPSDQTQDETCAGVAPKLCAAWNTIAMELVRPTSTVTKPAMSADARAAAGISECLLRLSVGIESSEDLVADLQAGLERAAKVIAEAQLAAGNCKKTVDA